MPQVLCFEGSFSLFAHRASVVGQPRGEQIIQPSVICHLQLPTLDAQLLSEQVTVPIE